jgi:hypothetical protein
MPWRGSILVMSVLCPGDFLYVNGHLFLEIWEIICHCFVEHITYTFGLCLFSLNAQDSQVCSFDEIAEFSHIPFAFPESFN